MVRINIPVFLMNKNYTRGPETMLIADGGESNKYGTSFSYTTDACTCNINTCIRAHAVHRVLRGDIVPAHKVNNVSCVITTALAHVVHHFLEMIATRTQKCIADAHDIY